MGVPINSYTLLYFFYLFSYTGSQAMVYISSRDHRCLLPDLNAVIAVGTRFKVCFTLLPLYFSSIPLTLSS